MSQLAGAWVRTGGQWVRGLATSGGGGTEVSDARFPGDPRTKETGLIYYGMSNEGGADITSFETAAGKSAGVRRTYWSKVQQPASVVPPGGSMFDTIAYDHSKGRIPIVSQTYSNADWALGASGGLDNLWDNQIDYLADADGPVWMALAHEPENNGGNPANFRAMQARFRARITRWETLNSVPHPTLAFGMILTAYGYRPADISNWWVANTFDWLGADHYAWELDSIVAGVNWGYFKNFAQSKNLPFLSAEWAALQTDPNGATKMQNFYDQMLSGTLDCIAVSYFNSSGGGGGSRWLLNNTGNGGMLNKHHYLMGRSTSTTFAEVAAL